MDRRPGVDRVRRVAMSEPVRANGQRDAGGPGRSFDDALNGRRREMPAPRAGEDWPWLRARRGERLPRGGLEPDCAGFPALAENGDLPGPAVRLGVVPRERDELATADPGDV